LKLFFFQNSNKKNCITAGSRDIIALYTLKQVNVSDILTAGGRWGEMKK
jgi:hypothetical protein